MLISDRALLVALINAVSALSQRLTGATMMLCLKDTDERWVHFIPDENLVTWVTDADWRTPAADHPRAFPKRCPQHDWPDATPEEQHQVVDV